jgi:flagellar basal body rod protein FlgG
VSREIYASLSGAVSAWTQLDVLSANVANVNTTGYKAARVLFESVGPTDHPLGESYAMPRGQTFDGRDGVLVQDGITSHLALQGNGFFALLDPIGGLVLTRDGRFGLDQLGRLTDSMGRPVMGESGPILLPEGESIRVAEDGSVYGSASGLLDRIQVVTGNVRPIGGNLLTLDGPIVSGDARVIQGALETSNVDPLAAMVDLIQSTRYIEAFQKAMQASDSLDERLNQSGGR